MRDVFRDIGRDISDAAKVDGANTWQIFWLIAIPLSFGRHHRDRDHRFFLLLE